VAAREPKVQLCRFFRRLGQLARPTSGDDTVSVDIPEGLDWFVWRIVTHERRPATLQEIETHWSLEDIVTAHLALDVIDELARKAAKAANPT
jgi:hypothetical protein